MSHIVLSPQIKKHPLIEVFCSSSDSNATITKTYANKSVLSMVITVNKQKKKTRNPWDRSEWKQANGKWDSMNLGETDAIQATYTTLSMELITNYVHLIL